MPKSRNARWFERSVTGEAGFTLLEMLVASSILALVIAIAMPLMLSALRDRKAFQLATDRVQSLRLAASLATQDARFATECVLDRRWVQEPSGAFRTQYLRLTVGSDAQGDHVVDYIFADKTDIADRSNLHRLQGTIRPGNNTPTWERDDIAGRDLVWTAASSGKRSTFGCEGKPDHNNIAMHLVTVLDTKTGRTSALDVFAYLRPN